MHFSEVRILQGIGSALERWNVPRLNVTPLNLTGVNDARLKVTALNVADLNVERWNLAASEARTVAGGLRTEGMEGVLRLRSGQAEN